MKLSQLIKQAQKHLEKEGDLDVYTENTFNVDGLWVEESDGSFPESWDMPKGLKFIRIHDDS